VNEYVQYNHEAPYTPVANSDRNDSVSTQNGKYIANASSRKWSVSTAQTDKTYTLNGSTTSWLKKTTSATRARQFSWFWEIVLSIISVIAGTAAIAVTAYYNKRRLTDWTFALSLNTLISVLGAISRASMAFVLGSCIGQGKWNWFRKRPEQLVVFDRFQSASRGPLGSMRLVWWFRFRYVRWLGQRALRPNSPGTIISNAEFVGIGLSLAPCAWSYHWALNRHFKQLCLVKPLVSLLMTRVP
jgi:hypothetical protein